MADNYSRKNRLSNPGVDPSYDVYDEDPLVELARIVSEDGGYFNIADRKSQIPAAAPELEAEPEADASDLGVDLESQLLEELELSMAGPDEADYADDFGDETYLPAEEEFAAERAYAPEGAEHAYAPEDAATLARLSEFPAENAAGFTVEAPVSPVGEWADDWVEDPAGLDVAAAAPQAGEVDFAQQYEAHSLTSNESADILSENELSDLEQTLSSSEGYFSAIPAEPEAGYVDDSDEDDEFDRDSIPGIPPVVPLRGGFSAGERNAPPESRSGRKLFAIAAVLSIAVLGGGVIAMMSSTSMTNPGGTPPVFKADSSPVKAEPDGADDLAAADGAQPIFDVASNTGEPAEEVLRDRTEKPVDRIIPLEEPQQTGILRPVGGDAAGVPDDKNPARMTDRDLPNSTAPKFDPIGPKTVTTMKVNADGTIIRPTLNATGSAQGNSADSMIVGGLPTAVPASDTAAAASDEPAPVPVKVVDIKTASNAADGAVQDDGLTSPLTEVIAGLPEGAAEGSAVPLPRGRPEDAPALIANASPIAQAPLVAQPAKPVQTEAGPVDLLEAAKQVAPRQAAPVNTGSTGASNGYLVQLSSQRSEEQAVAAFNGLKKRFPSLLGDQAANIQRADLGDRGVYYRVRVGPMADQVAAAQFCEQLKSSGGSCFVTR